MCEFSSMILARARRKCAGGLSPVKHFQRSNRQNLPKRRAKFPMWTGSKKNYGRYVAINLCNYHTIKFRLFKGTLKYNTLIATLELVNKICELAVLMDDDGISKISWSEFVAGIRQFRLRS